MDLLELARKSIESRLEDKRFEVDEETKKRYSEEKASFVTLTKNDELRGCIGSLKPRRELWRDVWENARNAAFNDPRFLPLKEDELNEVKIEVSVLSKPKLLGKGDEVFGKINKGMGIILSCDGRSSTFLPQVWEQISDKELFLEELSMKAGLDKDAWKDSEIKYYKVEKFSE